MKPSNFEHTQPCKPNYIQLAAGLMLLVILIIWIVVDPVIIIIQYLSRISNGTHLFNMLQEKLPGTYLNVYVFNVTNSEAFLAGDDQKLKIEEVGPYTYQTHYLKTSMSELTKEFRMNKDFKLDEDEGVMSYYPFTTAEFQPDVSIGDPRTVNVTVPNIAMLAAASLFSSYSIFARSGFNLLATQLKSQPIINLDLHSFLWGYNEPLITFGNSLIPGWITFDTMGILDRLYDPKTTPRLEVVSANNNKFSIKTMDGCPGLKAWQYENPSKRTRCNTFIDTYEGIAFPLGLTPERPIRLYRNIFCRMIELEFIGTKAVDYNPGAFVYKFRNNTFSTNSETECLCGNNDCVDGVSSMSPCLYGLSIGLSNAHFLHGDPKIYERIDGIHPDEKKHGSEFVIDPITGIILETTFTLQVNVVVKDVSFNSATRPFSDMVVPLCYLKVVQPKTNEDITYKLRLLHFVIPYVVYGIQLAILLIALIMLVNATKCLYWPVLFHKKRSFDTSNSKPTINISSETPLVEKRTQNLDIIEYRLDTDISF